MNKFKLALMAAGAWWVWTQVAPYVPTSGHGIPHTDPRPADPPDRRTDPRPQQHGDLDYRVIVGNINATWKDLLPSYRKPVLVLYSGQTSAGCSGRAEARMGPFYCPEDQHLYVPTSLSQEIASRSGCSGSPCQFVHAVVTAHEIGHHLQNLMGLMRGGRGGTPLELQADCLAGVWASAENKKLNGSMVETGDIEAAVRWQRAIGDDVIGGGRQIPAEHAHGTGAQRQAAFQRGFGGGTLSACRGA